MVYQKPQIIFPLFLFGGVLSMDFRELDEEGLTICPECKKHYKPILKRPEGDTRPIQQIFPDAPAWQREQLVTGLCSNKCWQNYIGGRPEKRLQYRLFCLDCEHRFSVSPELVKDAKCPKCGSTNVGSAGQCPTP